MGAGWLFPICSKGGLSYPLWPARPPPRQKWVAPHGQNGSGFCLASGSTIPVWPRGGFDHSPSMQEKIKN